MERAQVTCGGKPRALVNSEHFDFALNEICGRARDRILERKVGFKFATRKDRTIEIQSNEFEKFRLRSIKILYVTNGL